MFKLKGNNVKLIQLISLKVIIVACFFVVALFVFGFITREVIYRDERAFDSSVFNFFASFSNPGLVQLMKFLTFFGTIQFLLPAYTILVAYFIVKKQYRRAIDISIVAISSTVFMFGLKDFFHRERPELPIIRSFTYSFPSGHALCSFIFCSVLIYLIDDSGLRYSWKWVFSILLLLFSFTIGISRIILKMHYATDVIAGFCLGVVWVILSFWILKRVNYRNIFGKKKTPRDIDKLV
jgi:membrane-associated phospholipid phosphatase